MTPTHRRFRRAIVPLALGILAAPPTLAAPAPARLPALLPALLPVPSHIAWGDADRPVGRLDVTWSGDTPTPLLQRAVTRTNARLAALAPASAGAPTLHMQIRVGRDPAYLTVRMREHYQLSVTATDTVLEADGPAGVLHGLATLLQLVHAGAAGPVLATATIDDAPRFAWRGVMLDVSRHFASVDTVERQLDAMELTKLNVLHWHLSDGTGFRVESKRYPRLQQIGSFGQYYTQDQIRAVVAYAADRGIRVVPEIDVPGHTLAILRAYPALAAQQPVPFTPGWTPPCPAGTDREACLRKFDRNLAALNPIDPKVLDFVDGLFGEMARLFPDRYFHTGGDEVEDAQWTSNPAIADFIRGHHLAGAPALQARFTAQIQSRLARRGKIMIGWDEVIAAPIPDNVAVQVWRNPKWTAAATQAGHPVVVSVGYYLDHQSSSSEYYAADPQTVRSPSLRPGEAAALRGMIARHEAGPFTTDPDLAPLTPAQRARVIGAEAPLWTETVTDRMIDAQLWPRSAAFAERVWSAADVTDTGDLERRLPLILDELDQTGLRAKANPAAMIDALTPTNVVPLQWLTRYTAPARYPSLRGLQLRFGDDVLTSPAAIATPDSAAAWRFNALATQVAAGDTAHVAELRNVLATLAGLDAAYEPLATTPALQRTAPTVHALSELARLALQTLQPGPRDATWHAQVRQALAEQDATVRVPSPDPTIPHRTVPESGLVIAILPGLHALLSQAD